MDRPSGSITAVRPGVASAMAHRPKTVTGLNVEHVLLRDKAAGPGAVRQLEHVLQLASGSSAAGPAGDRVQLHALARAGAEPVHDGPEGPAHPGGARRGRPG